MKAKLTFKDAAPIVVSHYKSHLAIAKVLGYSDLRNVSAWANGLRPYPPLHCVKLESDSGGVLNCRMLRPEDFADFWPELAEPAKARA